MAKQSAPSKSVAVSLATKLELVAKRLDAPPRMLVQLSESDLEAREERLIERIIEAVGASRSAEPALLDREQLCQALGISTSSYTKLRHAGLPTIMVLESPRHELAVVIEWLKAQREGACEVSRDQ